jgi:hypothetical protein
VTGAATTDAETLQGVEKSISQAKASGYPFFNALFLLVAASFRVRFFRNHDFFNNLLMRLRQ